MIFDELGLPKDNGASDWADSSRLAGLMAVVLPNDPATPDLRSYFIGDKAVRHPTKTVYPENEPRCMSRDQLVCLAAGLKAQNNYDYAQKIVDETGLFAPNDLDEEALRVGKRKWKVPDLLLPHVREHFKICAGRQGSIVGAIFLAVDIFVSSKFLPMHEQNQMQCLVIARGKKWVSFYKKCNPKWKEATLDYWATGSGAWRNEPVLAAKIIEKIEAE